MKRTIPCVGMVAALLVVTGVAPAVAQKPQGGGKLPTGVLKVLDFDSGWAAEVPQMTQNPVTPVVCQTVPYVAGKDEIAIIAMDGYLATLGSPNDFIQLKIAVSKNGSAFSPISVGSLDALSPNAGHVAATRTLELNEGVTYVFGPEFRVGGLVANGYSTCHGTVMIVRLAQ